MKPTLLALTDEASLARPGGYIKALAVDRGQFVTTCGVRAPRSTYGNWGWSTAGPVRCFQPLSALSMAAKI